MVKLKRIKVTISDELKDTARRWNDLLDELPGTDDALEITAENFEQFQTAFQRAGVTNDDIDRLQFLLIRFEQYPAERKVNLEHWGIAYRVSKLIKNKGRGVDAAYQDVADEVGLDKSSVGKIYRKFHSP